MCARIRCVRDAVNVPSESTVVPPQIRCEAIELKPNSIKDTIGDTSMDIAQLRGRLRASFGPDSVEIAPMLSDLGQASPKPDHIRSMLLPTWSVPSRLSLSGPTLQARPRLVIKRVWPGLDRCGPNFDKVGPDWTKLGRIPPVPRELVFADDRGGKPKRMHNHVAAQGDFDLAARHHGSTAGPPISGRRAIGHPASGSRHDVLPNRELSMTTPRL